MSQSTTTPRRRRVRRITVVSLLLAMVASVAFAAVLSGANLRGTIGKGQFVVAWDDYEVPQTSVYELKADGTLSTTKVGTSKPATLSDPIGTNGLNRTLTLASGQIVFFGEAMVTEGANVALNNGAGRAGYVSGLQAVAPVPAGWKIALVDGCGDALSTTGTHVPVQVQITPTNSDATALDLTALGLQVVATAGTAPASPTCASLGG